MKLFAVLGLMAGVFVARADGVALPEDYTPLQWIQSTGSEWIDTGAPATAATRIEASFNPLAYTQAWGVIFGATSQDGSSDAVLMRFYNNTTSLNGFFCNETYGEAQIANLANTDVELVLEAGGMTANGQTAAITTSGEPWGGSVYLFCGNYLGSAWRHQAVKLYSFKMSTVDGETVTPVRDFVPCRNPVGEPGLWDKVEGRFYGNLGSGHFRAPDESVVFLNWIQSSGTQWIDAGTAVTVASRITTSFNTMSRSQNWGEFFGAIKGDNSPNSVALRYYNNTANLNAFFCNNTYGETQTGGMANTDVDVVLQKNKLTVNGTDYKITTANTPRANNLYIFTGNNDGASHRPQAMRLYSFKLDEVNGETVTPVRDFVPCRAADGQLGLWDKVNSVFHPNKGTGVFAAGDFAYTLNGTVLEPREGTLTEPYLTGRTAVVKTGFDTVTLGVTAIPVPLTLSSGRLKVPNAVTCSGQLTLAGGATLALDVGNDTNSSLTASTLAFTNVDAVHPVKIVIRPQGIVSVGVPRTLIAGGDLTVADLAKFALNADSIGVLAIQDGNLMLVEKEPVVETFAGYTRLQYVETTANQYLDSLVMGRNDTRILVDMQALSLTVQRGYFGIFDGTLNIGLYINGSGKVSSCIGKDNDWTDSGVVADTNRHLFDISPEDGGSFFIDGNAVACRKGNVTPHTTTPGTIPIGVRNYTNFDYMQCRIYGVKIYENDRCLRDFIPVVRDADGEIGFYERVAGVFYGATGGTSFLGAFAPALEGADFTKAEDGRTIVDGVNLTGTLSLAAGSLEVVEAATQEVRCGALALAGGTLRFATLGQGTPEIKVSGSATVTGAVTVAVPAALAEGTYNLVTAASFTVTDGASVTLAEGCATGADGASRTLVTTATGLQLVVGARSLPAGYTALETITSSGTQWIDTETAVYGFSSVDLRLSDCTYVHQSALFGQDAWTGSRCLLNQQSNKLYFHDPAGVEMGAPLPADGPSRVFIGADARAYVTRGETAAESFAVHNTFGGTDRTLFVFALKGGLNSSSYSLRGLRIAHGGAIRRDFVPCRNPAGEAGLWDFVEGRFFGNQGTGCFFGSDDPSVRLNWIQSSGTQWIDTGVAATLTTRIEAEFNALARSQNWGVFFGVTGGDRSSDGVLVRYYDATANLNGFFCNETYGEAVVNNLQGQDVTAVLEAGRMKLNGETATISTTTTPPYAGNIYLFCGNNAGAAWRHQAMRLYSFKMSEVAGATVTPVRDLTPYRKGGKLGLLDAVTGRFFANNAQGSFTYGLAYLVEGAVLKAYDGTLVESNLFVGCTGVEKTGRYDLDASAVANYPALTLTEGLFSVRNGTAKDYVVAGALTLNGGARLALDLTPEGYDRFTVGSVVFDASATAENPVVIEVAAPDLTMLAEPIALISGGFAVEDLAKLKLKSNLPVKLERGENGALMLAAKDASEVEWTGIAADGGLWSTAHNWLDDPESVAGANLLFNRTGETTAFDLSTGLSVQSVTAGAAAGEYLHTGAYPLYVAGGITNLSAAAQAFALPLRLGSLGWDFTVNTTGSLALTNVAEMATRFTKDGAGELLVNDTVLYKTQDVMVNAGTLKIGPRGKSPYLAVVAGTSNKTIWQNVNLADVFGVRAACAYGYSWNNQIISPFIWVNDGSTASVQFQVGFADHTKESEVIFTQSGNDVLAYIQAYRLKTEYVLGTDWHTWGSVQSYSYVPENIRPVCYNSVPLTTEWQNVWKGVKLSDVTGCAGFFSGASNMGLNDSNGYHWAYDAATDTATVQMQVADSTNTKVVMLELMQTHDLVMARAVKAGSAPVGEFPLGSDLANPPNAAQVAATPTAADYCICGLRPLPYGDCSGVITIADGARLDVNQVPSNALNLNETEMTHGKIIRVAGDGPDGRGAIYNSQLTAKWGGTFGHIVLMDDASVGGGRMDLRELAGSMQAESAGSAKLEGDYTLTVRNGGMAEVGTTDATCRFTMVNADFDVKRIRVVGALCLEGNLIGTVREGIWLADGACQVFHGTATTGAGIPFFVENGAAARISCEAASTTVNGAFTVGEGATLTAETTVACILAGAVTNLGAVVQSGAKELLLNGTLTGNGTLAGDKVRFGGTANCWAMAADDAGFTSKVDVSGVTDPAFLTELAAVDVTYTGDKTTQRTFVICPQYALTPEYVATIALAVHDAEGNAVDNCWLGLADGNLVLHLNDMDQVRTAVWTRGAGTDALDTPGNWLCSNDVAVVENGLPTYGTSVKIPDGATFNIPLGTTLNVREVILPAYIGGDCDWRGLDMSIEGTLDLRGHKLYLSKFLGSGTVTDTSNTNGFQRLDFIDSDGQAYVNTGYRPQLNTRIVAHFYTCTRTGSWTSIFGVMQDDKPNNSVVLRYYNNENTLNGIFCNNDYNEAKLGNMADHDIQLELKSGSLTVNGTTMKISSVNTPSANDLVIFCENYIASGKSTPRRGQVCRLYSFKIYENDTLKHDFVPARRTCDGAIGLLDVANGRTVFKPNAASSGRFLAGPIVAADEFVTTGELHLDVAEGQTETGGSLKIAGTVKLVKEGAGIYSPANDNQLYLGGLSILGGTLHAVAWGDKHRLGAPGNVITVGKGGMLDMDDSREYHEYAFSLAGGEWGNTTVLAENWKYCQATTVRVTEDSTIDFNNWAVTGYAYRPTMLDLGGKTLTMNTQGTCYFMRTTATRGTLEIHGPIEFWKGDFYGPETTLDMDGELKLDGVNCHVGTYIARSTTTAASYNGDLFVYKKFKPVTDNFWGCVMKSRSTIDLSERTGVWNVKGNLVASDASTGFTKTTVTFEDGATVFINLGSRRFGQNERVVAWDETTKPVNLDALTFKPAGDRKVSLIKKDDGIHVFGGLVFFVR